MSYRHFECTMEEGSISSIRGTSPSNAAEAFFRLFFNPGPHSTPIKRTVQVRARGTDTTTWFFQVKCVEGVFYMEGVKPTNE